MRQRTFLTNPNSRAPDKVHIFISIMHISWLNPMFYHLLELFHWDDSNKWSNVGFGHEITQVQSIDVNFMHLIWSSATLSAAFDDVKLTLCCTTISIWKSRNSKSDNWINKILALLNLPIMLATVVNSYCIVNLIQTYDPCSIIPGVCMQ